MMDLNTQQIRTQYYGEEEGTSFSELLKLCGLVVLFFALSLVLAWIRMESQQIAYELEEMKTLNLSLQQEVRQLRVEYKTMTSPAEIEKYAKSAGLISPTSTGVLIVERPFISAGQTQVAQSRELPGVMHE